MIDTISLTKKEESKIWKLKLDSTSETVTATQEKLQKMQNSE